MKSILPTASKQYIHTFLVPKSAYCGSQDIFLPHPVSSDECHSGHLEFKMAAMEIKLAARHHVDGDDHLLATFI